MEVIRRYECSTGAGVVRHYAQVCLDDGSTIELGAKERLPDAGWLALAAVVTAKPPEPEPTIEVECEDGRIV